MLTQVKCNLSELTARLGGLYCGEEQIIGITLYQNDVEKDLSTFNKAALDTIIGKDKFIGTLEFFNCEKNYGDPSYTESASGDRYKNNDGTVRFSFKFMYKDNRFHNQLYKLDRNTGYQIGFVDKEGRELGKLKKNGKAGNFKCNLFVNNKDIKTGAEDGGSVLLVDIHSSELKDWNLNSVMLEADDFSFKDINPITELDLQLPNLVAGATSTVVTIKTKSNGSSVTGLTTTANWKLVIDGVKVAPSAVSAVGNVYTFTHSALVSGKKVQLITDVLGYPVYPLDTNYYVGASDVETVA